MPGLFPPSLGPCVVSVVAGYTVGHCFELWDSTGKNTDIGVFGCNWCHRKRTTFVVCIGVVNQKQIVANYDSSCMHVNLCFVVCVVVVNHIATTIFPTFM